MIASLRLTNISWETLNHVTSHGKMRDFGYS